MLRIAIDGACRRNGKPDCVSAGGVFIQHISDDDNSSVIATFARSNYEHESTNQRGELLALLTALDYIYSAKQEAQVITDSEYLFNAMTKGWYNKWSLNGWVTATGEPVKNADVWREIAHAKAYCNIASIEINFYHIKGHVIPFGKVTAENLLKLDPTGQLLYSKASEKFDAIAPTKIDVFNAAQELSEKNNGFELQPDIFKSFVVSNVVVDAIATSVVEAADRNK